MGLGSNICAICGANYRGDVLFCPQDGAPLGGKILPSSDPLIGALLPGQIRIEKLIGVGAAGRVYRGVQSVASRTVAVKVLHAELSLDPTVVARFHREASVASMLAHPHLVEIFSTGELPEGSGAAGTPLYIVMEHIDGISLRSALAASGGALQLPRALRIVLQLCDAVGAAHARGIVHRDIKPENAMLVRRGNDADFVKVLDFGMARVPAGSAPALTKAGLIFGTARYISPEGAAGQPVGPAADVYAIATVLYQALAGQTPFEGERAVDVLARQINERPAALRSHARASHVPTSIADVILHNLAKRPEERSPDARAFARSLLVAARAGGMAPEALVTRSGVFDEVPAGSMPSASRTRPMEYGARSIPEVSGSPNANGERRANDGTEAGDASRDPATRRDGGLGAPERRHGDVAGRTDRLEDDDVRAVAQVSHSTGEGGRATSTPRAGTRGTLAFLLGCVAGGAALAALGAHLHREGAADDPVTRANTRNAGSASPAGSDAGFTRDTASRAPP
jgi:serine/threonine protein kinase